MQLELSLVKGWIVHPSIQKKHWSCSHKKHPRLINAHVGAALQFEIKLQSTKSIPLHQRWSLQWSPVLSCCAAQGSCAKAQGHSMISKSLQYDSDRREPRAPGLDKLDRSNKKNEKSVVQKDTGMIQNTILICTRTRGPRLREKTLAAGEKGVWGAQNHHNIKWRPQNFVASWRAHRSVEDTATPLACARRSLQKK